MKKLTLEYDSGLVDYCYHYTLSIDEHGLVSWEGGGAVETQSKSWRLYEGDVEEIGAWATDLKAQTLGVDSVVLDVPCIRLMIEFLDGSITKGVCYRTGDELRAWVEFAELLMETVGVNELVRPLWKRLADKAICLSGEDQAHLIERITSSNLPVF
ncbi:hypothetical protein E5C31_13095 [Providencia rettgeri]|nr:hypothetical protein [Providencia rettgeri]